MAVNPVADVTQVNAVQNAGDTQQSPSAQTQQTHTPAVPVDEVTLSPEAAALAAEQQILQNNNNGLSPAGREIQTEQRLAAAAAAGQSRSSKGPSGQTTPASLWKSAQALTSE
jgi:hypothetical protein